MAQPGPKIIYEGPPHYEDGFLVPGKKFHISGRPEQAREGVELARGVSGLLRPAQEYRYDTSAEQPGSTFVSSVRNRRRIESSINVFGDTAEEFHNNWRSWVDNNPSDREGKLWIYPPFGKPRYAFVRPNAEAGQSSMDVDPYLMRKIEGLEWGWESDYAYLFGEEPLTVPFDADGNVSFVPEGDVERMYPKIYLPGPGAYILDNINGFKTPVLTKDEVIRFNFDPQRKTFVKRNEVTGEVTNLWYLLDGKRPEAILRAGETFSKTILPPEGVESNLAYLEYTPLYKGAY